MHTCKTHTHYLVSLCEIHPQSLHKHTNTHTHNLTLPMPWWKAAMRTTTGTSTIPFASVCSLSVCPCRVKILEPVAEERRNITNSPRALKEYSVPSKVMKWRLPYTIAAKEIGKTGFLEDSP